MKAKKTAWIADLLDAIYGSGDKDSIPPYTHDLLGRAYESAFFAGKHHALSGLMSAEEVATHFEVTPRRGRELIRVRHDRYGVGRQVGSGEKRRWIIHRDELEDLKPEEKYRRKQVGE